MTYRHDPDTAGRQGWFIGHACLSPMVEVEHLPHKAVDGRPGDMWRCPGCGQVWVVGPACDLCADHPRPWPHPHSGIGRRGGLAWRTATLRQRIRYHLGRKG